MKKLLSILCLCMVLSLSFSSMAFASGTDIPSLDDVVSGTTETQTGTNKSTVDVQKNKNDLIDALTDASDMSQVDASTTAAGKVIQKWVGKAVQILSYVIVAGMALRVFLDLAYIALPFTRSLLANGFMGNPNAGGNSQQGMGGMGMNSGMGMGGFGGGFGGGYNRYGGGMGMGSGMGMQNQQIGMQTAMNNQPRQGRIQLVSNAALNAVASENLPGPDGETRSAYRTYFKDMAVVLVATPVLLTLAATGVMTNLGFFLADLLVNAIGSFTGGAV